MIAKMAVIFLVALSSPSLAAEENFSPLVDDEGNISFPSDFRDSLIHLGSWFVPDGGASGFHGVYTEKASLQAFRETGRFPDGATLVKELREFDTGDYTTGTGVMHSTTGVKQWFVMIKDTQNRFSNNPAWGEGWGWALFIPGEHTVNMASDYKTDCLACHVPAKASDWVYTEAYPVLNSN